MARFFAPQPLTNRGAFRVYWTCPRFALRHDSLTGNTPDPLPAVTNLNTQVGPWLGVGASRRCRFGRRITGNTASLSLDDSLARRSMGPLPIGGTALRAEVIRTDERRGKGGRKIKIHGVCMKCFANVLTVPPGVALISAE